jgi:hypothetical protein
VADSQQVWGLDEGLKKISGGKTDQISNYFVVFLKIIYIHIKESLVQTIQLK